MPPATASIFCRNFPPPQQRLDVSAREFLAHLGLPLVHPLCSDLSSEGNVTARLEEDEGLSSIGRGVFELPRAALDNDKRRDALPRRARADALPNIGPVSLLELHSGSIPQLCLTATTMAAPTLAMAELWLRLFAAVLGPLCLCWLLHREIAGRGQSGSGGGQNGAIAVSLVGLASAGVLATDSLYVYEYGRHFGATLFCVTSILVLRCAFSMNHEEGKAHAGGGRINEGIARHNMWLFRRTACSLIVLVSVIYLRSDGGHAMEATLRQWAATLGLSATSAESVTAHHDPAFRPLDSMSHPGIDLPTLEPGLYHSRSNPHIAAIVSRWPVASRTYDVVSGATPYLVTGDQRTGIPFLIHAVPEQEYVRVWVRNPSDGEYLALDVAFPFAEGGEVFRHNATAPVYLVLHGLNGGSHEEYVKDLVRRRRAEGSTVVVLIARGMMDTAMTGWNVFHGARTGDVDVAARALRKGLVSLAQGTNEDGEKRQILAGVGYSMGACGNGVSLHYL